MNRFLDLVRKEMKRADANLLQMVGPQRRIFEFCGLGKIDGARRIYRSLWGSPRLQDPKDTPAKTYRLLPAWGASLMVPDSTNYERD